MAHTSSFLSDEYPVGIGFEGIAYPSLLQAYVGASLAKQHDRELIAKEEYPSLLRSATSQAAKRRQDKALPSLLELKFTVPDLSLMLISARPGKIADKCRAEEVQIVTGIRERLIRRKQALATAAKAKTSRAEIARFLDWTRQELSYWAERTGIQLPVEEFKLNEDSFASRTAAEIRNGKRAEKAQFKAFTQALQEIQAGDRVNIMWNGPCSVEPDQCVVSVREAKIFTVLTEDFWKGKVSGTQSWYYQQSGTGQFPAYYIAGITKPNGTSFYS